MDILIFYLVDEMRKSKEFNRNYYDFMNKLNLKSTCSKIKNDVDKRKKGKCEIVHIDYEKFPLAEIDFDFLRDDLVYLSYFIRNDENIQLISENVFLKNFTRLKFGYMLFFKFLQFLFENNIKYVVLIPLDDTSGKLYKYYYDMGFRCVESKEYNYFLKKIKTSVKNKSGKNLHNKLVSSDYQNFFEGDELERFERNEANCSIMKATVNEILEYF